MVKYQNNKKSFNSIKLVEDTIELITSLKIQYHTIGDEKYIVCKELKILIDDNEYIINDGYKIIKTDNIKQLLMYVLVEITETEGLSFFKDRFLKLNELHYTEIDYLSTLSSRLSGNITPNLLYEKILLTNATAKKIGNSLNIPSGFIKDIRSKNRKAIIKSIICESLSNCSECSSLLDCPKLAA